MKAKSDKEAAEAAVKQLETKLLQTQTRVESTQNRDVTNSITAYTTGAMQRNVLGPTRELLNTNTGVQQA